MQNESPKPQVSDEPQLEPEVASALIPSPKSTRIAMRGDLLDFTDLPAWGQTDDVASTCTILDWLRDRVRATGTKEGCNEGDCGACTVVVGELGTDTPVSSGPSRPALSLRAVNACTRFMPTLHGKALFTVEDLKRLAGGALHPVQQAMVDHHGSQCGFCTPGFVMSLWSTYERHAISESRPDRQQIADDLAGNLCRCTGYRPIVDAGMAMFDEPPIRLDTAPIASALRTIAAERVARMFAYEPVGGGDRYHAPIGRDELAALRERLPAARLVAGTTDVALWVNKQFRALGDLIHTGDVVELRRIEIDGDTLVIGAGASLESAWAALDAHFDGLTEVWLRFAGPPVRHAGTMGGNVANGSPIGDAPPVLLALDASVVLQRGAVQRVVPLTDFYLDYMKNALAEGEFLESIRVPLPMHVPTPVPLPDDAAGSGAVAAPTLAAPRRHMRAYKLSKRYDCDISTVLGAFVITVGDDDRIVAARIAFGGMAAIAKRAKATETALVGQPWSRGTLDTALAALAADFAPITDMRASASYRTRVARGLLERFWFETRSNDALPVSATRVFQREDS